jgi:hypothetical protein
MDSVMDSTSTGSTESSDLSDGGVAKEYAKLSHHCELLMLSLSSYYARQGMMEQVLPIINGSSKCSLRLIDWFVTNYAKKYNTIIVRPTEVSSVEHFNVYLSYRSQLKAYSKQQFDPFRRRERILFYYEQDKSVETTIGQLNFFRWVLQNSLLAYITDNLSEIEADMVQQQRAPLQLGPHDALPDAEADSMDVKKTGRGGFSCSASQNATLSKVNHIHGTRLIRFD